MITLKTAPFCYYAVPSGRRYESNAAGEIVDVHPDDLRSLLTAGCFVERPFRPEAPSTPKEQQPKEKEVAKYKMKGVPGMVYQPVSGSTLRYHANRHGFFYAHPDHVQLLINAGCTKEFDGW